MAEASGDLGLDLGWDDVFRYQRYSDVMEVVGDRSCALVDADDSRQRLLCIIDLGSEGGGPQEGFGQVAGALDSLRYRAVNGCSGNFHQYGFRSLSGADGDEYCLFDARASGGPFFDAFAEELEGRGERKDPSRGWAHAGGVGACRLGLVVRELNNLSDYSMPIDCSIAPGIPVGGGITPSPIGAAGGVIEAGGEVGMRTSEGFLSGEVGTTTKGKLSLRPEGAGIKEEPSLLRGAEGTLAGAKSSVLLRERGELGGGGKNGAVSEALEGSATMMAGT